MFPEFLYTCCKNYLRRDRSVIPFRDYCKAFPDGDGIPKGYACRLLCNFEVLDGKATPPEECANNCGFEFRDGYIDPRVQAEIDRKNGLNFPDE